MSDPYVGEIKMVAFNFAPDDYYGWLPCDGRLLQINQYAALFSLLGTAYGGNGTSNFGIPNLNGRMPVGAGTTYPMGATGGATTHTLTAAEMPAHTHAASATTTLKGNSGAANSSNPAGTVPANTGRSNIYQTGAGDVDQAASAAATNVSVTSAGNGQAHNNMPPYQAVMFIIATAGIYPSRP